MKRKTAFIAVVFISILILFVTIYSLSGAIPYGLEQIALADELHVKIEDYPNPSVFPEGYFYDTLKPGMDIEEIHKIVLGYKKVFHCDSYKEIYYYFNSENTKALRFEIYYDKELKFSELRGEDPNSRTIFIEDCVPGMLVK